MKLVVPAIYEDRFPESLAGLPISHLYGATGSDEGLRASHDLPRLDDDSLAEYVNRAHAAGFGFFYCLNASCLGNREFTAEGQRWLVERLGWISDIGCDGVCLSNPYLVAFTKRRFPNLSVAVSSAAAADSPDKIAYFEADGADVIYLPEYVNRDFPLLRRLARRSRARLVALVNVGCLIHCPIRSYHTTVVSHARASLEAGAYVDYPLLWCSHEKGRDPAQMLKSPWIRPEDLSTYEELGISEFKLAGREMDPTWTERAIRAYAAGRYDGDLNDLILGFGEIEPFGRLPLRIPNRALDGFLEFFRKKHDCRAGCGDCRYCDDWLAGSGAIVEADRESFARRIGRALEAFESGAFRTLAGR
jgi:collagenase-like PrtC family protease